MTDLTKGSIHGHMARLTSVILFGMVFQTLYYLVDLYFVAKVGSAAVAAVGLSGNLMMVTLALTQALTIGTTALVSHAWGRKDFAEARRVFNQSQVLATGVGLLFVVTAFALRGRFAVGLSADAETAQAVREYLGWFLPAMGVQFLLVAMAAALRGAGEVKAPMMVQVVAVVINTILAPVLIAGWGTGRPLGVAGAGLATFLSICVGALLLVLWLRKRHDVLAFEPHHWRPDWALWRRMLGIGLPTGGEFLLMSVYATLIYGLIRGFGAEAQAGFGVGMRVLQTGFMPALAVAFAVAPIAGPELRRRPVPAGARDVRRRSDLGERHHASVHGDLSHLAGGAGAAVRQRFAGGGGRHRAPRHPVVQLPGGGCGVRGRKRVPGPGQHRAVPRRLGFEDRALRDPGGPPLAPARVRAPPPVVALGGLRLLPDGLRPAVAPPRAAAEGAHGAARSGAHRGGGERRRSPKLGHRASRPTFAHSLRASGGLAGRRLQSLCVTRALVLWLTITP